MHFQTLKHRSPSKCSKYNFLLDDCKSSDTKLLGLDFCSLVSVNNLPKSTTPHLTPLTLLETSTSYSMNTSPFLTRSHLSPNPAITVFISFAVSVHILIPKLLQLSISQPAKVTSLPSYGLWVYWIQAPLLLSSLRITDCSGQFASPHLWNQLPASLHQPLLETSTCPGLRR